MVADRPDTDSAAKTDAELVEAMLKHTRPVGSAAQDRWPDGSADESPVVSVTDSSKPDEHFVREAAVALLARDALVGHDSASAENAVAWARSFLDRNEQAAHDGDCTGAIHTCARCIADEALREASEIHDE